MRRFVIALAVVAGLSMIQPVDASAQDGFTLGHLDVGPTIGLGGINGAISFGGRIEKGFKELPDLGNGILGIQGSIQYYNWDYDGLYDTGFTYIPISVIGNYHFNLDNKKWDPFLGLGLGYTYTSFDCGPIDCDGGSGIYFVGRAGLRYFLNNNNAVYFDVGAGAASLNIGYMFKLN